MFFLIRILLSLILVIACVILLGRKNQFKKTRKIIATTYAAIGAVVLSLLLCFVVPERLLIAFNSPETAFSYVFFRQYDTIALGNESALAIRETEQGAIDTLILVKSNGKWFITSPLLNNIQMGADYKTVAVDIVKYNRINDLYIIVSDVFLELSKDEVVTINGNLPLVSFETNAEGQNEHLYRFYCQDKNITNIEMAFNGDTVLAFDLG